MERVTIRAIHTSLEHRDAIDAISRIMNLEDPDEADLAMLETLGILVERYEQQAFPLGKPTAIDAIRFRMEQQGLTQSDLASLTGLPKSRISELLNGKRNLSLQMVRIFHQRLGIPAEILIGSDALTVS